MFYFTHLAKNLVSAIFLIFIFFKLKIYFKFMIKVVSQYSWLLAPMAVKAVKMVSTIKHFNSYPIFLFFFITVVVLYENSSFLMNNYFSLF